MKTFKVILIVTVFLFLGATGYAQTGTITVTVTQIEAEKGGLVKIGLFDSKGFPIVGQEVKGVDLEAKGTSVTHLFNDISIGMYAISVFQDENGDGKINKNFLGAPKELYGFSRNKYGMFSPPNFEDVSFEVIENKPVSLTINLE